MAAFTTKVRIIDDIYAIASVDDIDAEELTPTLTDGEGRNDKLLTALVEMGGLWDDLEEQIWEAYDNEGEDASTP